MTNAVSPAGGTESVGDAESHFTAEALGEPAGPGRYVNVDALSPLEALNRLAAWKKQRAEEGA